MSVQLVELTVDEVIGLNRKAILDQVWRVPASTAKHVLRNRGGLEGCIGGVFMQLTAGYVHLPLEKMAGLLLSRIAQGQFFLDGYKRTAVLSTFFFLGNNGHKLRMIRDQMNDLIWGFAAPIDDPGAKPKYKEEDAVQYVFDNIMPVA